MHTIIERRTEEADAEMGKLDAAIARARTNSDVLAKEQQRQHAERQRVANRATAADATRARLEERRQSLLLAGLRDDNPAALAELQDLRTQMKAEEQTARDCRDAAERMNADIALLSPELKSAAEALKKAEWAKAVLVHRRETQEYQRTVEATGPAHDTWLASAERLEVLHWRLFGEPSGLPAAPFRAARFLAVRIREIVGVPAANVIDRRFPPDSGRSLLPDIEAVGQRHA